MFPSIMSGDSRRDVSQLTVSGLGSISQTSSINPTLDMSQTWFMNLSLVAWNWNVMSHLAHDILVLITMIVFLPSIPVKAARNGSVLSDFST